jgi:hypothetical protein
MMFIFCAASLHLRKPIPDSLKIFDSASQYTMRESPPDTQRHSPWIMETYLAFSNPSQAVAFENTSKQLQALLLGESSFARPKFKFLRPGQ